ncbi:hypothetical protein CF065_18700 [Clostridium sporogenes]
MIKLFEPTATDFTTNGIVILTNCIDMEIIEELNGNYSLNFKYPIEEPKIVKGVMQANKNIISNKTTIVGTKTNVNLPTKSYFLQKDYIVYANKQPFRIYNVKRNMSTIEVNCRHIFYDLLDNFLEDVRPTNLNRMDALKWVLERTQYPNRFTFNGNLGPTATRYFIRKNPVDAIMGQEGILETWGGEIVRDNFNVGIWDSRGNDRGVLIQGGKNLVGIEEDLDTDNVITRIMPTGLDENDTVIMLPEKYIDSPYINAYPHPKIRHMHYGDIKINKETNITKDDVIRLLRLKIKELYEVEKVDIPQINYKVDFIELSKTEEYKNYISLEKVEVGDTVTVRYNKLNLDIKAKVIKTTKKLKGNVWVNEKVELGNFKKDITSSLNKIDSITTPDGKVKAESIWGPIDAAKATLKAMSDSAETQVERAILFEDKDPTSSTYGALCMGTRGFQIASSMTNGEWQWTTFGTGKGFTADLISAGVLQSLDGSLKINLQDGSFLTHDTSGNKAIQFNNQRIFFYDWGDNEERAGIIYTSKVGDEQGLFGLSIGNYTDYEFNIVYQRDDTFYSYVTFDKYLKHPSHRQPITIYENMDMRNTMYWYFPDGSPKAMMAGWNSGLMIGHMGDNSRITFGKAYQNESRSAFACLNHMTSSGGYGFWAYENAGFSKNVDVHGNFWVGGTKNSLQKTKDYGDRLINAYETLGYYFGDYGRGTTDENGECLVEIDDLTTQVMNTDIPYHVIISEYCSDNLTLEEMRNLCPLRTTKKTPTYFIVRGEPNTEFSWILDAKRIGYENHRAEEVEATTMSTIPDEVVDFDIDPEEEPDDMLVKDDLEDILLGGM